MPSPVGHLLAGGVVALLSHRWQRPRRPARTGIILGCAALAALPDADLIYQPLHRTVTHSLVSIPLIAIIATLVTGWVTGRRSIWVGVLCGLAWGSHIPLDWLGADPNPPQGIQALWPFSSRSFISGVDLFASTERRHLFSQTTLLKNLRAVVQEILLVGPVLLWLWLSRGGADRRRRASTQSPLNSQQP